MKKIFVLFVTMLYFAFSVSAYADELNADYYSVIINKHSFYFDGYEVGVLNNVSDIANVHGSSSIDTYVFPSINKEVKYEFDSVRYSLWYYNILVKDTQTGEGRPYFLGYPQNSSDASNLVYSSLYANVSRDGFSLKMYLSSADATRDNIIDIGYVYFSDNPNLTEPRLEMQLCNVSDPLTSDFYADVLNPLSDPVSFKVFYRAFGSDDDYRQVAHQTFTGHHQFMSDVCGIGDAGSYMFVLYDSVGIAANVKYMDLYNSYNSGLCFEMINAPPDGGNLTKDFQVIVYNPKLVAGALKVFKLDSGNEKLVKEIFLLSYNGFETGFGSSFDKLNKTKLPLNFTDLGLSEKGNYSFRLYNEELTLVQEENLQAGGFDYSGNSYHKDNSDLLDYDFGGIFDYPELPDDSGIITYIKWFCKCVVITFASIGTVFTNFIKACSNVAVSIGKLFSWLPAEFRLMIPIVLAVALLLRILGR